MTYQTSLDNLAKGITISVSILFTFIIAGQFLLVKNVGQAVSVCTALSLLVVYVTAFAFRPIHYILTQDTLKIHRLFSDVTIPTDQINTIEVLDKNAIGWTIRTFGVGGLFGYYGKFANVKLGQMTWYATRKDKAVLVSTIDNRKIILTPDEPEKFAADFKDMASSSNFSKTNPQSLT